MMKKNILLFLTCFLLVSCGNQKPSTENHTQKQLNILTTVYPFTYFTEKIGGQYVNVNSILTPESDIHNYQLNDNVTNQILSSQLFLYIDDTLEPYIGDISLQFQEKNLNYIEIISLIKQQTAPEIGEAQTLISGTLSTTESPARKDDNLNTIISDYHLPDSRSQTNDITTMYESPYNHLWLHPSYAIMMCEIIRDELIKLLPEYKPTFDKNFEELKEKLLDLNNAFLSLSTAPNHYFLVTHAAYSTWAGYGLIQIPITDMYESPLPQQELETVQRLVSDLNLSYLYFEENITNYKAKQLQSELHLKTATLYNLATLTYDQINNGDDYFSLMYQNIKNLELELYE